MGFPAGIYNLIIEQGASHIRSYTYTDEDGNTPDLSSGYTAELVIASAYGGGTLLTKTSSDGITLGASGSIAVNIPPADTAGLAAGEHLWRLDITKTSSGRTDRLLKGAFTVEAEAGS
jgi:hypothetical protein